MKNNILSRLFTFLAIFALVTGSVDAQRITGKVPLVVKQWYKLNNTGDGIGPKEGFQQLTNGITDEYPVFGYGMVVPTYECYYEFSNLRNVELTQIRLNGGKAKDNLALTPVKVYVKSSASSGPQLVATFNGAGGTWQSFNFPAALRVEYLILSITGGAIPSELELSGSYELGTTPSLYPRKEVALKNTFGDNSFIWEFLDNATDTKVGEKKMSYMRAFAQYRDYLDWGRVEAEEGKYSFDHTLSGGWNYDEYYARCKKEGKDVLICLKTLPEWFLAKNYPSDQRDVENIPAAYTADKLNPASYILQAKVGFQISARYGRNSSVDPALLSGVVTGKVYPGDPNTPVRTRVAGLNLITYVECENERDKWWKGRKAYQTGREYAANLSAFYDGHMGKLGPGVGVKAADPTMQVVMAGTAGPTTDYVRGIIDWCKENRGFKADGSPNLCFDVINYHLYANENGESQSSTSTRGAAPEVAGLTGVAQDFVTLARQYNLEVWVTETGYDLNQTSALHVPSIGSKTPQQVQADWMLRTSLLYAREGVSRVFHYQTYDLNPNNGGNFNSSGMLNPDGSRRPVADYFLQTAKLMGNYVYKETLSKSPIVDRYEYQGKSAYVVVMPTENGSTGAYNLALTGGANAAKVYRPTIGLDSMRSTTLKGTTLSLTATETPQFIFPSVAPSNPLPVELASFTGKLVEQTIRLQWVTATELNVSHFVVELSQDGKDFRDVHTVNAVGTSTAQQTYLASIAHTSPTSYVRLRTVDKDTKTSYSQVLVFSTVLGLGNPANVEYVVWDDNKGYVFHLPVGEAPVKLYLYDMSGRLLSTQKATTKLQRQGNRTGAVLILETQQGSQYMQRIF